METRNQPPLISTVPEGDKKKGIIIALAIFAALIGVILGYYFFVYKPAQEAKGNNVYQTTAEEDNDIDGTLIDEASDSEVNLYGTDQNGEMTEETIIDPELNNEIKQNSSD